LGGRSTKGRYAIPELPEVETVRRELASWLTGQVITKVRRVHAPSSPKYADLDVAVGKRIVDVTRRGKFLLLPLVDASDASDVSGVLGAPSWELIIHLGMTGAIKRVMVSVADGDTAEHGVAEAAEAARDDVSFAGDAVDDDLDGNVVDKHVRVQLELLSAANEPSTLLFEDMRRFGRFLVVNQGDYRSLPTLNNMGPEPFDETLTEGRFWQALQGSKTAIKTYLLSQKPLAGVGNIYADEALWQARIHPKTPAFRVSQTQAEALLRAVREVLAKSIELQGTTLRDYRTVNGDVGQFADYLQVYGKTDEPCARCGHPIERLMIGGRSSHFCPACQKRG
jgi:formamidopyrimidine-DNA glycosylase